MFLIRLPEDPPGCLGSFGRPVRAHSDRGVTLKGSRDEGVQESGSDAVVEKCVSSVGVEEREGLPVMGRTGHNRCGFHSHGLQQEDIRSLRVVGSCSPIIIQSDLRFARPS